MFKNVRKEEITIPAQMSFLTQVRDFIERIGKKYRFSDKITNSFKLVVDEACTNVIRHGYRDIKNGEITLKAIIRRLSLTIVIIDQGRSYDPRQANTPDLAKYIDIGKKGGLGILMMRKLMDDIHYTVTERGNEFRLTKYRDEMHESRIKQSWHALNLRFKYSILAALAFTALALLIFIPIYYSVNSDVRDEVFAVSASGAQSLADNVVNDLLDENNALMFEKAYALLTNNEDIIEEVFVLDADQMVQAWGNPLRSHTFDRYTVPPNAVQIDTLDNIVIFGYSLGDTAAVFDLTAQVRLAGDRRLGEVHVLVNEESIKQLAFGKKLVAVIVLLVILIIGYIPLFFLIQKILAPFHSLADWVRQVVHGKVDQDEIDIDASDELGEIAQAFNEMTYKFREAQVTLMEQQKLQKELQVAQEIQQMLLPSDFPKVEGYEIASYYEAAKEVGGDLFDFMEVDDDTIGICVADVSGKGVPGSLIMTMIRTAMRLESRGNKNPADVLARVNRFVADDMKRGMFVTMFYVILDSRNRMIHYASAGHNPMILYRGSTKQTYYLNPSGFPVGIQLPDIELFTQTIQTDSIRLREDDILVLYTDGITEAMNAKRELFREERFLEAIRQDAHLDVGEFIRSINGELKTFTGGAPQNDDITVVAIKEKLMQGEVIYRIHEELVRLIDGGMKVKDALEQLRVSPHHYYKHKDIVGRRGLEGLKEFLEDQDYIEKKHLSIEVKTKVFDIIRKHPEYGPRMIAYELRNPEYGELKVDPDRIYSELVKLRLNKEDKRRIYAEKGGKRRLKQPGTPLLTLDGKVILNFESSEQEVASRYKDQSDKPYTPPPQEPRKETFRRFNVTEDQNGSEPSQAKMIYKQAKPFEPAADQSKAPVPEKTEAPKEKQRAKASPRAAREKAPKTEKPVESLKEIPEEVDVTSGAKSFSSEELKARIKAKTPAPVVDEFYKLIEDDIQAITKLISEMENNAAPEQDIKKVNTVLKIVLKHPVLKELDDVRNLFVQIQDVFAFLEVHHEKVSNSVLYTSSKDLLFYLEKDNKFESAERLFEVINAIGLMRHRLTQMVQPKDMQQHVKLYQLRERLAQKHIIHDNSILETLAKHKDETAT